MKQEAFLQNLEGKTKDTFFISESEHPFVIESFGAVPATEVTAAIAQRSVATTDQIKKLTPEAFFSKIEKGVDPGDAPIVANWQKIKALHSYLNSNLSNLQVYRVESGVQVPIFVLGALSDGTIVGVKTISIES